MSIIASSAAEISTALAPVLPRVGFVAVTLPDGDAIRTAWVDTDALIVGYDPRWLTHQLAALIVREQIGAYVDIDAEVTQ